MKICFACRAGPGGAYIARRLADADLLDQIIVETGERARGRKLQRIRKRTRWWAWPALAADLLVFAVFSKLQGISVRRFVRGAVGSESYPDQVGRIDFADINDPACVAYLRRSPPDILIVFGTGILTDDVIAIPRRYILNIHTGIVPRYRNVHSEFWAYVRRDLDNIGTSILHLDPGIDTGDVAAQARIPPDPCSGYFEVKRANLRLAADLIVKLLHTHGEQIPRSSQESTKRGFYHTPKARDILRLMFVSVTNRFKCLKARLT